ncbi:MAG: alpha-2-macroglobulin [Saprospiraceae bacterium]|nr:alpha-2-macroglobulin [Saprospiraceae bacterium]
MEYRNWFFALGWIGILGLFLHFTNPSQSSFMAFENYEKEWAKVDSLDQIGQYASARKIVGKILEQAKKEVNNPQQAKCISYEVGYMSSLEEGGTEAALQFVESEIAAANKDLKAVLQSMLASYYQTYLQNRYWQIQERTTVVGERSTDQATWSPAQLESRIAELFLASVSDPNALAIPAKTYEVITSEISNEPDLRPQLYDLLAHRALDYFSNSNSYLNQPSYAFYIDDPKAFAPYSEFVKVAFQTEDTTSFSYRALQLFQDVLSHHLTEKSRLDILLDADLRRLQFVYNKAVNPEKASNYLDALHQFQVAYAKTPNVAEAFFLEAQLLYNEGSAYQLGTNDEELLFKWRKSWQLCQEIIDRYPSTYGASQARQLISSLERKDLQIQMEKVYPIGAPLLSQIQFRNLEATHFRLIKINDDIQKKLEANEQKAIEVRWKYLMGLPTQLSWKLTLPKPNDFHEHLTEMAIDALPGGRYVLLTSSGSGFSESDFTGYIFFQVSNLAESRRSGAESGMEVLVVDRQSGAPQTDAQVEFYRGNWNSIGRKTDWNLIQTARTDKSGFCTLEQSDNSNYKMCIRLGDDALYTDGFYNSKFYQNEAKSVRQTHFFLDRAIYRPGQTIYFKALVSERDPAGKPKILPNQNVVIYFRDNNYQLIEEKTFRSNEFGTVEGTFVAPEGRLLGQMHLASSIGGNANYFRVEEYKRPKFEVSFDPVTGDFKVDEEISVQGKATAFAGNALDEVQVNYRVVREVQLPWWARYWYRYPSSPSSEIAKGQTTTAADGSFEIQFEALPDRTVAKESSPIFNYTVYADVIDGTGETHTATSIVRVGYVSLTASIDLPDVIRRDSFFVVPFTVENLNGQAAQTVGNLKLEELQAPIPFLKERYWPVPDLPIMDESTFQAKFPDLAYGEEGNPLNWEVKRTVWDKGFDSGKFRKIAIDKIKLNPGTYRLTLTTTDDSGQEVKAIKQFQLFDPGDRNVPGVAAGWLYFDDYGQVKPGESMNLFFGNPAGPQYFLVESTRAGKLMERKWIEAKGLETFTYLVKEEDRGALKFNFLSVYGNRFVLQSVNPQIPWDNKDLKISFRSFRDKLLPGQEEVWEMKISGPNGAKVAAEFVGALYDASLDQIVPHGWSGPSWPTYFPDSYRWNVDGFQAVNNQWIFLPNYPYSYIGQKTYRQLNVFAGLGFNTYPGGGKMMFSEMAEDSPMMLRSSPPMQDSPPPPPPAPAMGLELDADGVVDMMDKAPAVPAATENAAKVGPNQPGVPIRTNLKETVFFMPQLRTDPEGNVMLQFTMNEALTKWKFLGFAHTKELQIGQITAFVQTQKPLMVQPNPPRFYREGDQIEFTSKVVNLSEESLSGNVQLQLVNPLESVPVFKWEDNPDFNRNFTLEPGRSTTVTWRFKVPDITEVPLIEHTVLAQAGDYADAERDAAPVLSNRQLVTESLPLAVRGNQTKTYTLQHLANYSSTSLTHTGFTLEFTSNPAWYAVQALPYMMEYPHECSEQLFSRFYANSLATSVANSSPRVKEVFESWKGTDAMESPLSLNEELKSALLAETPWVLQAQSEAEQRRNIGLLFDLQRMATEQAKALAKLQERQLPSGGFAWFPGGRDNWYITQYIVEGLGHLDKMGVRDIREDVAAWNMTKSAVRFIDAQLVEHYEELEREVKKGRTKLSDDHLDQMVLHYLYARSFFLEDRSSRASKEDLNTGKDERYLRLDGKIEQVVDYYLGQSETYWTKKSQYMQGMIGLALKRLGRGEVPALIVKALKEQAVQNEELGAYWLYPGGLYWYQAPVETHALMIELFDEVGQDTEMVELLKIWLLKNKQTNRWSSTKSTAAAVYALLMNGDNWLEETGSVQITLGPGTTKSADWATRISGAQKGAQAGTGYFKTHFNGEDVSKEMATVEVSNPNKGIAWGAVYWQYMEDLDKIEHFEETPLKIVKQVYKVTLADWGEVLEPLIDGETLHPGDKLKVRIELRVDRDMEYVHMKDMRASGFEPIESLSSYKWQEGLGYYESPRDVATDFFISYLTKGTHVFEYPLRVIHRGDFSNGITTVQCMYAPEFTSHSEGIRLKVE